MSKPILVARSAYNQARDDYLPRVTLKQPAGRLTEIDLIAIDDFADGEVELKILSGNEPRMESRFGHESNPCWRRRCCRSTRPSAALTALGWRWRARPPRRMATAFNSPIAKATA